MTTTEPTRKRRTDRERAQAELDRARAALAAQRKRVAAASAVRAAAVAPLAALEARVAHLAADPALAELPGQTAIDEDATEDEPQSAAPEPGRRCDCAAIVLNGESVTHEGVRHGTRGCFDAASVTTAAP